MNRKRFFALFLALMLALCCLGGCGKPEQPDEDANLQQDDQSGQTDLDQSDDADSGADGDAAGSDDAQQDQPPPYTGPVSAFTGLPVEETVLTNCPVAVMVNNLKTAQTVQTGLNDAQLIFETYVEGGITRLMAVYEDIAAVQQIGTIRSARYPFVELAMGLDAIYVHNGEDNKYCGPQITALGIRDFDLIGWMGKYSFRENNGLAYEHTLYTTGSDLVEGIGVKKWDEPLAEAVSPFTNFLPQETVVTPADGVCSRVNVPFSGSYHTEFRYDEATGRYVRYFKGELRKDCKTGEDVTVKNVFVLLTDNWLYPDQYHVGIDLDSGSGWYISNGGYENIRWSKGDSEDPLVITKADGSTFTANAGNSWICLVDKDRDTTIQ